MRRALAALTATPLLFAALTLAAPVGSAHAQVTVVDEGTFSLVVGGTRIGREDFSIRRTTGGGIVAQGNILRGDLRTTVALNADSAGAPDRFRVEAVRGGQVQVEVSGERRGLLWSGLATFPAGERGSEFRLPAQVLVADAEVVHHLWFVARFGAATALPRLDPRTLRVDTLVIEAAGADRVMIGLEELDARKFVVRDPAGRRPEREVWTDGFGRLLRVRVAAEQFEALRDELPDETPGA